MCGIAGVYHQNGHPLNLDVVREIGKSLAHRGPDNFSCVRFDRLGLSHNRLSLLDLTAAANQPFKNDSYALVYNGEIYNFREIRERLIREHGIEFRTTSDTEVLFHSLIVDGIERCLKEIRGMFAFVFFDADRDELWLARDRLGIKPLYFCQRNDEFYWSSEIKALAEALDLEPDPVRTIFAINGSGERSREATLFSEIHPIKPGTFLKVSPNSPTPQEFVYYDVFDDFDENYYRELDGLPHEAAVSEFERLFVRSVEGMVVADAPLGAFVSGGIDSSLIATIAKKSYPELKLFTSNVVGKYSEFEGAKRLSEFLGTPLHDEKFEPEQMLSDWAEVTYFYECPIIVHTNAIPFSGVARLASEMNVKAVLTGEGADELFLGYPRLLTQKLESIASFPVTAARSLYKLMPRIERLLFPDASDTPLTLMNRIVQNFSFARLSEEADDKLAFLDERTRRDQFLTIRMLREHLTTLLHRNDRMGMMASIEARFPFLDEEVVKFAVNLPVKFKIGRSYRFHDYKHPFMVDKWIVRKLAERSLPKSMTTKKKNGFPMMGHKFVRIHEDFFRDGWVTDHLGLTSDARSFMVRTQDPYFLAKLASIEIFGRIFGRKEPVDAVKEHIMRNATLVK